MLRKNALMCILLVIASSGNYYHILINSVNTIRIWHLPEVECSNGPTELYSKVLDGHNYLVPPRTSNISVTVSLELSNLERIVRRIAQRVILKVFLIMLIIILLTRTHEIRRWHLVPLWTWWWNSYPFNT